MKGLTRDVARRVLLAASRGVLRLVDDETRLQSVQLEALRGEVLEALDRIQEYGFTSVAAPGADAVLIALGGQRQHSVVVALDDRRYRPTGLAEGDVCLYTLQDKAEPYHRIHFKAGHVIEIRSKTTVLTIEPRGMTLRTPSGTQTWGTA